MLSIKSKRNKPIANKCIETLISNEFKMRFGGNKSIFEISILESIKRVNETNVIAIAQDIYRKKRGWTL